jgi:hypothetical protein
MDKVELPRLTLLQRRVIAATGIDAAEDDLLFQHTVFCQTCLPYSIGIQAMTCASGPASTARCISRCWLERPLHPETERFVPVGLPFGPCVPARPWSRWRALYFR